MDYRLPVLSAGLLAAAIGIARGVSDPNVQADALPATTESAATQRESRLAGRGSQLIADAIDQLSGHQTISAKVRHRTQLFEQRMVGSGIFLQKRSEPVPLVRFSLSIQAGDRAISLLHICDGRFLWIRENFEPPGSLSRIDLRRLRNADNPDEPSAILGPMMLGGGVVQLMKSLETNFDFSEPYQLTFQSVPVWAIDCTWKRQRLQRLMPKREQLFDEDGRLVLDELPEHVPDRVFVLLGQDDLFPYHFDFRRSRSAKEGVSEKQPKTDSLVTMELFEVQLDMPINPSHFSYKPGDIEITDGTDEYITRLRRYSRGSKER